ncbi:MAG: hypothetical protein OXC18_15810 [Desulfurellaceae bacterium]|nr:hypothetical protein [Desulfurellaceae bacterium]
MHRTIVGLFLGLLILACPTAQSFAQDSDPQLYATAVDTVGRAEHLVLTKKAEYDFICYKIDEVAAMVEKMRGLRDQAKASGDPQKHLFQQEALNDMLRTQLNMISLRKEAKAKLDRATQALLDAREVRRKLEAQMGITPLSQN